MVSSGQRLRLLQVSIAVSEFDCISSKRSSDRDEVDGDDDSDDCCDKCGGAVSVMMLVSSLLQ